MRCYHFCNFYLASIHAGIQSAHAQHELATKYLGDGFDAEHGLLADNEWTHAANIDKYLEWAKNHKTMILLNGGMQGDLIKIEDLLASDSNRFPYASFREDDYALNGALTNVCIVLPYQMYELNYHIMQFSKEPWPGFYEFKHDGVDRTLVRLEDGTVELRANTDVLFKYNAFDLELIKRMSAMKLM